MILEVFSNLWFYDSMIFPPSFSYGKLFKLVRYNWYCFAWYLQLIVCKYLWNFLGHCVIAKVSEHMRANACIDKENAFKAVFLYKIFVKFFWALWNC